MSVQTDSSSIPTAAARSEGEDRVRANASAITRIVVVGNQDFNAPPAAAALGFRIFRQRMANYVIHVRVRILGRGMPLGLELNC